MNKALIVGIDYYEDVASLYGCVADARTVKQVLERHEDGSLNFSVRMLISTGPRQYVSRNTLRSALIELFSSHVETALFYFSGHGYIDQLSGYLISSECSFGDDGLSLNDILVLANQSPASNKIIILDSCHAGAVGSSLNNRKFSAEIAEGVSFISASRSDQYALEVDGSGVFTQAFIKAVSGAAADLLGRVTLVNIFAQIEQSFGLWEQTPVIKHHSSRQVCLRQTQAAISHIALLQITTLFPEPDHEIQLDPSYLPHSKDRSHNRTAPDPKKTAQFELLRQYSQLNLVSTLSSPCITSAAIDGTSCKLTPLGQYYHLLVSKQQI